MEPVRNSNDEQWHNPDNWSGWGPFSVYFSKQDSRAFVPKYSNHFWSPRSPNYGHPLAGLYQTTTFLLVLTMLFITYRLRSAVDRRPNTQTPASLQAR